MGLPEPHPLRRGFSKKKKIGNIHVEKGNAYVQLVVNGK